MKHLFAVLTVAALALPGPARTQAAAPADSGPPTRTTFVRLTNNANAILVEPVTPVPGRSRIALIATHPDNVNNFNNFTARELPRYGYRTLMLNYYGREQTWDEFIAPIAAAISTLRAIPGVEKVVFIGHSSGGTVLSAYQDIAENGPKTCQRAELAYKCQGKDLENLPKADGIIVPESYAGAAERTLALNPAVDDRHPRKPNPALDMFSPANGYDPATHSGRYSSEFRRKYFAAQVARANRLIDAARARLASIEAGQGDYKDDEPFVVPGQDLVVQGARPDLADVRLMSKTHAPHLLLKSDGSKSSQIIPLVMTPRVRPEDQGLLFATTLNTTVRHYLAVEALRLGPDYAMTEDNVTGVQWRSTTNSLPGNLEGIHVPTLVMSATCAARLVFSEIAFDHSAAKDKELVGVEGAGHTFQPCRPEYGDTFRRTFDYIDGWLTRPGRFD